MFNKTFVTLYFLEKSVLIVELDAHKKRVIKHAVLPLPEGLIQQNKTQDVNALSLLLKNLWRKVGFHEKTVGIIIPEFSTFTKVLSLPKLSVGDLGEAISWQAQEYLPVLPENVIMDWKILKKEDEKIEVLVVAIPKEILLGYTEACRLAGLFPSVVQTPSVALTNLITKSEGISLIVYLGESEAVLILAEGEKILGTSVLSDRNTKDIIKTANRMLSHFGKKVIKTLFVGGVGIDENIVNELKNNLNSQVSLLKVKVSGVDERKVQEMLIPMSMQLGPINEPSDPNTLNLLPANLVERYRIEKTKIQVWSLTLTTTLFVWVSFLMVLGSYLIISQQILALKSKNDKNVETVKNRTLYETDATHINETAAKVLQIKSSTVAPELILNNVNGSKPAGITISGYRMDFEKGEIEVFGVSDTRSTLITFKQNLEKIPLVKDVNIPISSFEEELNLDFDLTFRYGTVTPTAVPALKLPIKLE